MKTTPQATARGTRAQRGLVVLAALAALGAGGEGVRRHDLAHDITACEAKGAAIDELWNDEARARVRKGLMATGASYAQSTADRVVRQLDERTKAWHDHRTDACLEAHVHETWGRQTLERSTWCLEERRLEMAELVAELHKADDRVVREAIAAVARLRPVSPCLDVGVLSSLPPLPRPEDRASIAEVRTELARGRARLAAGRYAEGLDVVRSARRAADDLGWPPLAAEVRRVEGALLERSGAVLEAEKASTVAYAMAVRASSWAVAAAAAEDLVYTVGYQQARHAEGRIWATNAELAASFAGDPLRLHEADRLGNLAHVHHATGDHEQAKVLLTRALELRQAVLGPGHPDTARGRDDLARVHDATGEYEQARELFARSLAVREQTLGPGHPRLASSLDHLAAIHRARGEHDDAKAMFGRTLALLEKALGPEHPEVGAALHNLAMVHRDLGEHEQAKARLERALTIERSALGPEHPRIANGLHHLGLVHRALGERESAVASWEQAAKIREQALGPEHPLVALDLGMWGDGLLALDRAASALPPLERAIAIYDAHPGVQEFEPRARFALARVLVETAGDRDRALAEARRAGLAYREAGEPEALAEVERWLTEQEASDDAP